MERYVEEHGRGAFAVGRPTTTWRALADRQSRLKALRAGLPRCARTSAALHARFASLRVSLSSHEPKTRRYLRNLQIGALAVPQNESAVWRREHGITETEIEKVGKQR